MTATPTPTTTTPTTTASARRAAPGAVRPMPVKSAPKARRTPIVGKRDRARMWGELVAQIDRADTQDIPAEWLLRWCADAARVVVDAHPHHSTKTSPAARAGDEKAQERRVEWLRDSTAAGMARLYRDRARQRAGAPDAMTQARRRGAGTPLYDRAELRTVAAGQI